MIIPLKANEMVVKAGDSTYFAEAEKVGGKLILTNQRIYFKSSNGHGDKYDLEILPAEISEVIFFKTGMLRSGGLNLVMKNGDELKFSIRKRDEFGSAINRMY